MNDLIGKIISHYRIVEQVGQGGMGIVYKAKDIMLDRFAALKFLSPQLLLDNEAKQKFIDEAKAASSLDHNNICTIYEIAETGDGSLFIAMAFYEGETLNKKILNSPIELDLLLKIAQQISNGLLKAHETGIIHRDIKPANIILTDDERIKILDFGLAKLVSEKNLTQTGNVAGTPQYMSPEQALGKEVDNRTDIWSFGVLLYEMLTGISPFKREYEQAIIYSIINEEPDTDNSYFFSSPLPLQKIILKCLQKAKSKRYDSFKEIIKELDSIQRNITNENFKTGIISSLQIISPSLPQRRNVFFGREIHKQHLIDKLNGIKENNGWTIFISGEPGIGKTQLVSETLLQQRDEVNIFWGRCLFNEGGLPYHPFVSAIKGSFEKIDNYTLDLIAEEADHFGFNLKSRLPYLRSFFNLASESSGLLNKEQLWDSILILLKSIANIKPLILVLDDIQWADKTTLDLFSFISRNIYNVPILLIGIYRPEKSFSNEKFTSLIETIRQLKLDNVISQIELQRFNKEETKSLIQDLLETNKIDEIIFQQIFQFTEGNPLFIVELLNLMKDKKLIYSDGSVWYLESSEKMVYASEKVQDVIKQRIEGLKSEFLEILEVASCEGEYFQSDVLASCVKIDRIQLLKNLQAIEMNHKLIRHFKNQYRFDHILIRQVIYDSIIPELREEYHRMISNWLIKNYSSVDEYASRIAHHLIASRNENDALKYLIKSADHAKGLYAIEDALNFYQKAEEILNEINLNTVKQDLENIFLRCSIEQGIGDIYLLMGKSDDALKYYLHYLSVAENSSVSSDRIKALRKLAEVYRTMGNLDEAMHHCIKAYSLSEKGNDVGEKINCLNIKAFIHANKGEYDETISISNEALKLTNEINDPKNQSISLSNIGFGNWHKGNYKPAMEFFEKAITIQRSIGDSPGLSTTLNFLALAYWKLGFYEQGLKSAFESVKIKKSIADLRKIPGSLNVIADIYRDIYDLDNAIKFHNDSLIMAREHQNKGSMCDNIRDLGADYILKGDYQVALSYLNEVLELAKSSGLTWYETRSYLSLGELYLLTNELQKAKEYINLGSQLAEKLGAKELIIEALWDKSKMLIKEESYDKAVELYEDSIEIAEPLSYQTFLWQLYFGKGNCLKHQLKFDEMKIAYSNAKKILQEIINHFEDEKLRELYTNSVFIKSCFKIFDETLMDRENSQATKSN